MLRVLILSLVLFVCSGVVYGQKGTVRGTVLDKTSGEPIIYGNVLLEGTTYGNNTDLDGFFSISGVPVGEYVLLATYLGYDTVRVAVNITDGALIYETINLSEGGFDLGIVNVSAKKQKSREDVLVSKLSVSASQIKSLPSTGGEADIAQYLSVLPGVVFTGDQGGQLYIRGGSPVQNKILLDGMTIYNPFHSIGFFSVFETETIKNVDVLTGGFDAEYGGRISAVVDITTRAGNKSNFSGIISANPFQSKILLEGPIKKYNPETGGSSSFIVTAKRSYIDQTSSSIYSYATTDSSGTLPFNFTDIYGKLSLQGGNGSKLNLFGFNYKDQVTFQNIADLEWTSSGGGANFTLIPSGSNLTVDGVVAFSNYDISLNEDDGRPRSSSIGGFNAGLNFTSFGSKSQFKYGFEINGFNTNFTFVNFLDASISQTSFTTEISAYIKYKMSIGDLVIEPSFRLQYYASLPELSPEPRIGLKYNINDQIRFKFAAGLYSQNLISSVNETDVVNLFVGFLSGPEEAILSGGTNNRTDTKLQTSRHAVAGLEIDITDKIEFNVEPYFKDFTQIININRNKIENSDPNFAAETGEAYGIDFLINYTNKDLLLWFTYSYGFVNRDDGNQIYPTIFDRRHNLNSLVTYKFGETRMWEASARWNFGTGFPFTLTQGFNTQFDFQDGITTDVVEGNPDEIGVILDSEMNGGRLPDYHRLDLSVKRTFIFSPKSKLEATLSVTNAYDRENIFFFDRVTSERVDQLPILPSVGLAFHF